MQRITFASESVRPSALRRQISPFRRTHFTYVTHAFGTMSKVRCTKGWPRAASTSSMCPVATMRSPKAASWTPATSSAE